MNDEQERWWNRFKVQVSSMRAFVANAQREDQLEALDAFQDVLEEIRTDFLEETQEKVRSTERVSVTEPARQPLATFASLKQ